MYGPTPKISWSSRIAGPRPESGIHSRHRHRPVVTDRHLLVALRASRAPMLAHRPGPYPHGVRLDEFDYELPAGAHRPGARSSPATRRRLLVDRGSVAARAPHRRRPARPAAPAATSSSSTRRKVIPARLRLRRATGGAAEVLLLEPRSADRRTWEALVRPGPPAARRGAAAAAPTAARCSSVGARTGGRRHVPRRAARRRRTAGRARRARRDAAAAVHPHPPGAARSLPDGLRHASRARPPRRPPACT